MAKKKAPEVQATAAPSVVTEVAAPVAPVVPEVVAPAVIEVPTAETYCLKETFEFYEGGHKLRVYPKGTRADALSDQCKQWVMKNDPEGTEFFELVALPDTEAATLRAAIEQAEADVANATERSTAAASAVVAATDAESMATAAAHNDAMSTALQQCQRKLNSLTSGF